jgi:hypothetical protein
MTRVQRMAARLWRGVALGAGLGFLARDLLALPAVAVAVAWVAGALLGAFGLGRR